MKIGKKGFTLVELVIVMVIVGILSVISVPIYRGYVEKAMMTEGKVLINAIAKAELAYLEAHGEFLSVSRTSFSSELDINTNGNKFFRLFMTEVSGTATPSSDIPSAYGKAASHDDDDESVDIWVYGSNNGRAWELHTTQYSNGAMYGYNDDIDVGNWIQK